MRRKSPQVAGDEPTEEFHVQARGQNLTWGRSRPRARRALGGAPDFMKPSPGRLTKHKIHNAGFEPEVILLTAGSHAAGDGIYW